MAMYFKGMAQKAGSGKTGTRIGRDAAGNELPPL